MLLERVTNGPEIRTAVASQGANIITAVGINLTVLTERLDDALERIFRRSAPDSETIQAGLVTRMLAGAFDFGLLFGLYAIGHSVLGSPIANMFGQHLTLVPIIILSVLGVVVGGGYFAAFWSLAGQTPGMSFLSIRLAYRGSNRLPFGVAVWRVFVSILSLVPLGLGYLNILHNRSRHAWNDSLTGVEVVYYDKVSRTAANTGSTPIDAARHRRSAA